MTIMEKQEESLWGDLSFAKAIIDQKDKVSVFSILMEQGEILARETQGKLAGRPTIEEGFGPLEDGSGTIRFSFNIVAPTLSYSVRLFEVTCYDPFTHYKALKHSITIKYREETVGGNTLEDFRYHLTRILSSDHVRYILRCLLTQIDCEQNQFVFSSYCLKNK